MDLKEFKTKYPDIAQALSDEGHALGKEAGHAEGMEAGRQEQNETAAQAGAQAERDRIQAVGNQYIPGHEALIETLKFDGKTTGEQAAVKVLQAEKKLRVDTAEALAGDAPDPVPHAVTPTVPAPDTAPKDPKAIWDQDESLRAEFLDDFDKYSAFTKADAAGQIRIVSRQ